MLVFVQQEHEGSLEVFTVVMQHFVVVVEIVYEVPNEQKVVGFKGRQLSHFILVLRGPRFFCLNERNCELLEVSLDIFGFQDHLFFG